MMLTSSSPLPMLTASHPTDSYRPLGDSKGASAVPTNDYGLVSKIHYAELGKYLASYLAKVPSNSRSSARLKLARLTIHQFHELSTDVYDELLRRQNENESEVPFLPVTEKFHPKRNEACQRFATLPVSSFEDLSGDVYFELARRYPEFEEDTSRGSSPSSATFSDSAVPTIDYQQELKIHYTEFGKYLTTYSPKVPPNSHSSTRLKLSKLTIQQLHELSTDFYDELWRRKNEDENKVPFLPVTDNFHPKRNEARQKLATLPVTRFEDLSGDVYFELARRYPEFKEDPSGEGFVASTYDRAEMPNVLAKNAASTHRELQMERQDSAVTSDTRTHQLANGYAARIRLRMLQQIRG